MFEVGEKVVYPNHGVSVVEEISSAKFDEIEQVLFHLRLLSNNSKVMVPKDNLELVGLRPLCTAEEIQALIDNLGDGNIDTHKDWKGRYKQNLDKMKTGQLIEVAEVLKNLCLVSQKKSLSFREKKMYERAKYFIVSEVAQVREIADDEAETLVEDSLEASLEKLRKLAEAAEAAEADAETAKAKDTEDEDTTEDVADDEPVEATPAATDTPKPSAKESAAKGAQPAAVETTKAAKKPAAAARRKAS